MESRTFTAAVLPNCKVKWTWLKAEKSLYGLDIASTDLNGHAALLFINFLSLLHWLSSSHYYPYICQFYFLLSSTVLVIFVILYRQNPECFIQLFKT